MMPVQTLHEVTYPGYLIECSSRVDIGMAGMDFLDALERLLSFWTRKQPGRHFYSNFYPRFEVDLSSIKPHFEIRNETSLVVGLISEEEIEPVSEEELAVEMLEHDYIVKMPPKKRYKIQVHVKSIKKGEPSSVESDDFSVIE